LLTQLINPYFHFVIDIIEKSGGDVVCFFPSPCLTCFLHQVKFIGDAILVKWELKDQTKAECVALACSGCLRLLERLGNHFLTIPDEEKVPLCRLQAFSFLTLSGQAFPLSMHIGLGVGEVYDMHLGSPKHGRFEYFLDGKALKEAVHLVNVASQRELVISDEALTYLQGEVTERKSQPWNSPEKKIKKKKIKRSLCSRQEFRDSQLRRPRKRVDTFSSRSSGLERRIPSAVLPARRILHQRMPTACT